LKEIDVHKRRNKHLIRVPIFLAASLQISTLLPLSAIAQPPPPGELHDAGGAETITPLPDLNMTTAGEPLLYLSTPNPVISSDI
jgi:hypothetical protein